MAGPIWARQAMALAGVLGLCGCTITGATLANAGAAALMSRFDVDRDGALEVEEVTAMIAASVPGKGAELDALRAGLAAGYWTRDCDRDGRLTAGELGTGDPCK